MGELIKRRNGARPAGRIARRHWSGRSVKFARGPAAKFKPIARLPICQLGARLLGGPVGALLAPRSMQMRRAAATESMGALARLARNLGARSDAHRGETVWTMRATNWPPSRAKIDRPTPAPLWLGKAATRARLAG